jgi:hypothetical protein
MLVERSQPTKGGQPMSAHTTIGPRFQLGPIDQISFAVADLDEAVPRYTAMFGGPFNVIEVPRMEVVYRGRPSTTALKIAFGRTADIEVELVQVVAGDWPTVDWLATHGEVSIICGSRWPTWTPPRPKCKRPGSKSPSPAAKAAYHPRTSSRP